MELLEWMENKTPQKADDNTEKERNKFLPYILVGGVCIILLIMGMLYVGRGRDIYFWDDATYWDMGRAVASGALKGDFWHKVYESIGSSDYNYLASLPSAAWMSIFGQSRLSYAAGLIVMYIFPSSILTYRLAAKLSKAPWAAYLAAVFGIPATLYLAAVGFVDVGGYMMALACYNLYYTSGDKCRLWRYALIGLLLVLMMLFRRYFAFFAVSFITAMIIDCILFHRKWSGLITACIVASGVTVICFMPFVTGILLKDYGTLYSGYKYSLVVDMKFITRYFGALLIIVLLSVPVLSGIKKRDCRPVFALIQIIVCGTMFMATQTHGQQHLLMYIPSFTVLTMFLVNLISKRITLGLLGLLVVINAVSPGIKRVQPTNIQEIKQISVIPTFSMRPKIREDASSVIALKRKLDNLIPEGAVCNVLASSFVLNDSILRNAEPSLGVKINRNPDYIKALPEVDSRDSWRLNEIYEAEYVLVAFPSQTHLAPGSQTIVDETVASFENGTDIAQAFEQVDGFDEYIGKTEVKLYHRIADIDVRTKEELEERLFYTVE